MSIVTDCFENIIGLSRNECNCFDTPSEANDSASGIFLDEQPGLNLSVLDALNDCENGSLWDMMKQARAEAVNYVKTDLIREISMRSKLTRQPFSGWISDIEKTRTLNINYAMAGAKYHFNNVRGGIFRLKRIGFLFSQASTFTASLYDNLSDTAIVTIEVTTVPNVITWVDLDPILELPMSNSSCRNFKYYVVYPVHYNMPKDNQMYCGCSGAPRWDFANPDFTYREKYRWSNWMNACGIKGNDISLRPEWNGSEDANGILLDADLLCGVNKTLCSDDGTDFVGNPLAMELAQLVRMKASEILLIKILKSTDLDRVKMLDRETVASDAGMFAADYITKLPALADEWTKGANLNTYSDCFTCPDSSGPRRGRILK